MRTVEHPKELFRQINATSLDEDSHEFSVYNEDPDTPGIGVSEIDESSVNKRIVEFSDLSRDELQRDAALDVIRENSTKVDSEDNVPDCVDAQFVTEEDGKFVVYMCDTTRMGYEVISQETPKEGGYSCIFPDSLVKVVPSQ